MEIMTSDTITVGITNDCRKQVLFFKSTNDIIKQKYLSAAMANVSSTSGEMSSWGPNLGLQWADQF